MSTACAPRPLGDGFVVAPERLSAEVDERAKARESLVVLDVRAREKYEAGHLDGARWLDAAAWAKLSHAAGAGLFDVAGWRTRIGEMGIDSRDAVIVYDGGEMTESARIWFILRLAGVSRTAVLDGGFAALAKCLPPEQVVSGEPPRFGSKRFETTLGSAPQAGLSDKQSVDAAVRTSSAQVWDARTPSEFAGRDLRGNPRGGHVPGAVNLSHAELLDERGRLRGVDETRKLLMDAGLNPNQPVITYCQSGGRAALASLAALRCGFGQVRNYYMSFGEWSADERCPIETADK
ncbi:MAG: rhodanese-like domain-containing protein [Phycisphaerae bacterium]